MCRKQISKDSGRTTQNALGLFEELEKQYNLGTDRLGILKQILKQLKKRSTQEGGRVWDQEKRWPINASHICFEI